MLDAYIIEQIKRREEQRREEQERPVIQIPLPPPIHEREDSSKQEDSDNGSRGAIIIDL